MCSGLPPAVPHTCTFTNIVDIKRHTHIISHTPFEQTQYTDAHTDNGDLLHNLHGQHLKSTFHYI